MQIRLAHTTDAAAVNGLLHQLGYPQDGTATMAARIRTWGDDPSSAAYVADTDGDPVPTRSRTAPTIMKVRESRAGGIAR